ncbi:MAG: hypothetical protein M5U26_12610 [Planctomycetota bacterium]|nr:hypothetical protein [Planctomycetota bacterium]
MQKGNLASPFRKDSALHALFEAFRRSSRPLKANEAATRACLPVARAQTLIAAMRNPYHNATMRRAGVELVKEGEGYLLRGCKVEKLARRPGHGMAKKQKKRAKSNKAA